MTGRSASHEHILLAGGRVVDPAVGLDQVADVLVSKGVIAAISPSIEPPKGALAIDCTEKIVMPGLVDLHVHLRDPGREDKETILTGSRAAVHGGFTAVCAMPNTSPICDTASAVRYVIEAAEEQAFCRVYPIGAVTMGSAGTALAEIADMHGAGAVAFSDDGHGVQDAGMQRLAMDYAKMLPTVLISHCEDEALAAGGVVNEGVVSTRLGMSGWPAAAEEIAVARDIRLAQLTGCRLHLAHLSTAGSVELVRAAKEQGIPVTCEATPHHLFLDEDAIDTTYDTNLKINPPLRTVADREALLAALLDGTVDCIATDHAPHASHEKELEFEIAPFGTTGLETALSLVNTHLVAKQVIDWPVVVERMCHGARTAVPGLPEMRLAEGQVADITVFDPEARVAVTEGWFESLSANSAFLGVALLGKASEVLVGGRIVLRNGKVVDR
ncbi:MAG: dihydroorotase [Actinomycetota bacterium]|nr:dihydroorotase [Actinomycetota bacterium]